MRFNYPYLNDATFLKQIDELTIQEKFVKLTVLNWGEMPVTEIQGRATGGSLNVGTGSVRRNGSIEIAIDSSSNIDLQDIDNIISVNKKVAVEIGITNTTDNYPEYDIVWLPQGIFVLTSVNITHSLTDVKMSVDMSDKMCLLNGDVAGQIGSAASLGVYEDDYLEADLETSALNKYNYLTYYDLIMEVVHHLGGEDMSKIIIRDIPPTIKFAKKFAFYTGTVISTISEWIDDMKDKNNPYYIPVDSELYDALNMLGLPEQQLYVPFNTKQDISCFQTPSSETEEEKTERKAKMEEIQKTYQIDSEFAWSDYICWVDAQRAVAALKSALGVSTDEQFLELLSDADMVYYDILMPDNDGVSEDEANYEAKLVLHNITESGYVKSKEIKNGTFLGYTDEDFTYSTSSSDTLTVSPNETITSVLEKIKGKLSNYEYFYDIHGNFIFQEIKNYLNTSKASTDIANMDSSDYLIDRSMGDAVYTFDDSTLVTTYTNALQYTNIKNDYMVWGDLKGSNNQTTQILYHLAIDDKPEVGNIYSNIFLTQDLDLGDLVPYRCIDRQSDGSAKYGYYYRVGDSIQIYSEKMKSWYDLIYPLEVVADFSESSTNTLVLKEYSAHTTMCNPYIYYYYDIEDKEDATNNRRAYYRFLTGVLTEVTIIPVFEGNTGLYGGGTPKVKIYDNVKTTDWRAELLLQGLENSIIDSVPNKYYSELRSFLPKIYNVIDETIETVDGTYEGNWREDADTENANLKYYIDFLDGNTEISKYSINNIGKRTYAEKSQTANCLYEPVPPNIMIIDAEDENLDTLVETYKAQSQYYMILPHSQYLLMSGDSYQDAFNEVRNLLYQYTGYTEVVTMTTIPIYHMDVNTRVSIRDTDSGIMGDYMITSFSVPFDIGGTTSFSCTKCLQKI